MTGWRGDLPTFIGAAPYAGAAIAVAAGALGLLGWALDVTALKGVLPGFTTMKLNTAGLLVLSGAGLALRQSGRARAVALLLAIVPIVVGAATLAEYLFALDLGIDELLVRDPAMPHPGRMAPNSAVAFLLFGAGLLSSESRSGPGGRARDVFALAVFVLPFQALVGYLYGVRSFLGFGSYTHMALHTVAAFLALSVGLLFLRPHRGLVALLLDEGPGGFLVRRVLLPTVAVVLLLGWLVVSGWKAGLYDERTQASLLTLLTCAFLAALISVAATRLRALAAAGLRAEKERAELLRRMSALINDAPALILLYRGPSYVYEVINPMARRTLGDRDLIGQTVREVFPDIDEAILALFDSVYRTGESITSPELAVTIDWRGDGVLEERCFNAMVQATRDGAGAIDGVMSFAVDVTDQVRARRRIEQLAEERERALKARDEFLAVASHELRSPLTAQILGVQLLAASVRSRCEDAVPIELLLPRIEGLERTSVRLKSMVELLLDVSRITAEHMDIQPEEVDLRALLTDVVARHAEPARRAGCALTLRALEAITCCCDPLRFDQVATNLIGNALKYGHGAPVEVTLLSQQGQAYLVVRDHGIGIAEKDQARIFERFERAVPVENYGGLGLGLWITRRIVGAHGGELTVDSRPGEGATFTARLPLCGPAQQASPDGPTMGEARPCE